MNDCVDNVTESVNQLQDIGRTIDGKLADIAWRFTYRVRSRGKEFVYSDND